ncbi:response regulator [Paenibacillus sp. JDR-2]|uniref:response regulator n=1 Tax=Paenibacillus sp. (strain JDR-2) TaxID=324057 RepID=UPI000166A563|nr:response regulator [Paenibacillus sp. JDR-2]ACT00512.1 two component transcriptional regulator, AraC family [Paenibacillus sp. JDR-2]
MCKLLIVDDEEIERGALRLLIERFIPEVEIVGESENGRTAIDMAETLQPDLITMDIKMPGIDGVEAVQAIHEKFPEIKFIMVSAFDTFDYARKVMRSGVKEFLVKPCKKEKTIESVVRTMAEVKQIKERRLEWRSMESRVDQSRSIMETEYVTAIMMNYVHDSDLFSGDIPAGNAQSPVYSAVIKLDFSKSEISTQEKKEMYGVLRSLSKQFERCMVGPMIGNQIPLFIFPDQATSHLYSIRTHGMLFARKVIQSFENHYSYAKVFIGIGSPYLKQDQYVLSYHEALLASGDTQGYTKVRYFADMQKSDKKPQQAFSREVEKSLIMALRKADKELTLSVFDQYLEQLFQNARYDLRVIKYELEKLFDFIVQMLNESGFSMHHVGDLEHLHSEQLIREFAKYQIVLLINQVTNWYNLDSRGNMEKAKSYITDHYADDLSLEVVADYVQLNPHYFSKLFHERCGITFVDYLTQVRISKAKELLAADFEQSLKEISMRVGYRDPNYFSRVFKKLTGLSPSEFRQTHSVGYFS